MVLFCTQVLQRVLAEALQEPQSGGNSAPEPLTSLSIQKVRRSMPNELLTGEAGKMNILTTACVLVMTGCQEAAANRAAARLCFEAVMAPGQTEPAWHQAAA